MNAPRVLSLLAAVVFWLASTVTLAHEVRPGYLELREAAPDKFAVLWKVPVRGDRRFGIRPQLPEQCGESTPVATFPAAGALIERWTVACEGGLSGHTINIDGLQNTLTDVLVRVERLDAPTLTVRLQPDSPSFVVSERAAGWQIANTYLWLGVEHILLGIDHLLFVLALLIIVKGWRRLVATITSFTLAHSITLAVATLGYVHVPQQPVEAMIALSILFLATEIVHRWQGRPGLTQRWPWLVAFTFGLLHGFGFAGALAEVGLPEDAIPLALLFFNIGVELGQLLFVGAFLLLSRALAELLTPQRQWATEVLPAYLIGSVAAYWTLDRVTGFWTA
jgi:hydrogenase/urease accessory protein HupE